MANEDVLNQIEDKGDKKPISKTTLFICSVMLGLFIFFYIKDRTIGIVIFILFLIVMLFWDSKQNSNIALTIGEARELLVREIEIAIREKNRFGVVFPKDMRISDVNMSYFGRLRDSQTFELLEWHIGFKITKNSLTSYYLGKVDYWIICDGIKGNGVVGIEFLGNENSDEFRKVTPIQVKPVAIDKIDKWNSIFNKK